VETEAVTLKRQLTLLEYGTCSDETQAKALFEHRESLQPYLKEKLLTQSFDGNQIHIRAAHFVGLMPFSGANQTHWLLVAPKGCREDENLGLLRFLELIALSECNTPPETVPGLEAESGPNRFLLFLAYHYAKLLRDLCLRDFRSYYRHEEGELRGRIRGRLRLADYTRLAIRGKPHVLACRWDEFTVDNWDNRILWAAARRLKQVAASFDPRAAALVWRPFERLIPWFSAVAEVPIRAEDFRKSRLGRTSRYYRHALAWARLLLQGGDLPTGGGQVPPLVLNTHQAFEKFAEVVVRAAFPEKWEIEFQKDVKFLERPQAQVRRPDISLSDPKKAVIAVGDAKYKEVLEHAADDKLATGSDVFNASIQHGDWNQLYVYMRLTTAPCGFFVLPFWNKDGNHVEWLDQFEFAVPPCDGSARVGVLALNLLRPLGDVKQKAAEQLRRWLSPSVSPFAAMAGNRNGEAR